MRLLYQPGSRIDHYQIICPLGGGAASRVYLAQDWQAQQEVVLKFPRDDIVGGVAVYRRYQREAQIGEHLSHPYLLRHLNQREQRSKEIRTVPGTGIPGRAKSANGDPRTRTGLIAAKRGGAHPPPGMRGSGL